MAETVEAVLRISLTVKHRQTVGLASGKADFEYTHTRTLTSGTGSADADQINEVWSDERTLAASATEDLDLAGALTNLFGTSVFAKIKVLIIENIAAVDSSTGISIGGALANGFITPFGADTDTLVLDKGGVVVLESAALAGYAVVAGTGDKLTITNLDGTNEANYKIIALGNS